MILGFSTKINGKPTHFVERIHKCFSLREVNMVAGLDPSLHYPKDYNYVAKDKKPAKLHTIREDKTNRWKAGMKIDFFINVRTKDMFRFAPVLPVVSVQSFEVEKLCNTGEWYKDFIVLVDNLYQDVNGINQIALNDGFDTVEDFFSYFNENFKGKLIHWTDKKY